MIRGLLSRVLELPHHNSQRAATVPIMIGMMVQIVAVACANETHMILHLINTALIRN